MELDVDVHQAVQIRMAWDWLRDRLAESSTAQLLLQSMPAVSAPDPSHDAPDALSLRWVEIQATGPEDACRQALEMLDQLEAFLPTLSAPIRSCQASSGV